MAEYLVKPEEVFDMYSEALRILDENTVKYMVDELKEVIKNMYKANLTIEQIAEITGNDIEVIKNIIK